MKSDLEEALNPTEWREQRLGDLLAEALDLPADQRVDFLEASGEEPSLIEEVALLLDREQDLTGILAAPAAHIFDIGPESGLLGEPGLDLDPPSQIGPFRLLYSLGKGGMGQVYLAEQSEPVERQVALKIALQVRNHPEARRRFLLERQALGRLTHPNVARLYEAGTTPEGRAWVAMELVDGPQIITYCDQRGLSIRKRIELFVDICRGAHHAHQKQILHRDLKPGNILVAEVDGRPVAKIIDFGIAKALDQPFDHTFATGNRLLGTPHYMSPEALQPSTYADIDTRTDIYSLGVVLYELMTGARPFLVPASDLARLLKEILEQEPQRPSLRLESMSPEARYRLSAARGCDPDEHLSSLRGDLDWIVSKAMAKDRDRRYASAAEMADELQRYLDDLPILARPPSHLYRLEKFWRRNRPVAIFTSLITIGLVAASIMAAVALVRARDAEQSSRENAQVAERTLGFVVELFDRAGSEAGDPYEVTARDLLAEGVSRLRAAELSGESRSRLLETLGEIHLRLGLYTTAQELLSENLGSRRAEFPEGSEEVLRAMGLLGEVERLSGHLDAAAPLLEQVVTIRELHREQNPLALADAWTGLAHLKQAQGLSPQAESLLRRALRLRVQHLAPASIAVAATHRDIGDLLSAMGRHEEATQHFRSALEGLEKGLGPKHPDVAEILVQLAQGLRRTERFAESELLLRRSLEVFQFSLGPDHPKTVDVHGRLASLLVWLGRFDEAEISYRRALSTWARLYGEDHAQSVEIQWQLSRVWMSQGELEEAGRALEYVLDIWRRNRSDEDEQLLRARRHLAEVRGRLGQSRQARAELEELLALQSRISENSQLETAHILLTLGELELRQQRPVEARARLNESLSLFQSDPTEPQLEIARALYALGQTAGAEGSTSAARDFHRQALEIRRKVLEQGHPDLTRSEAALAKI